MKLHNVGSNQTELRLGNITIFFSYTTPVAAHIPGKGYFRTSRKYSVTTSKHINRWLDGARAETRDPDFFQALADGTAAI